jgi:hypothetical protein
MYTSPSSTLPVLGGTTAATAATATQLDAATTAAGAAGTAVQPVFGPVSSVGTNLHGVTNAAGAVTDAPSPGSGPALADVVHSLPFTGVNVFFLILTAITMLLMGLALVRMGRTLTTREGTA